MPAFVARRDPETMRAPGQGRTESKCVKLSARLSAQERGGKTIRRNYRFSGDDEAVFILLLLLLPAADKANKVGLRLRARWDRDTQCCQGGGSRPNVFGGHH